MQGRSANRKEEESFTKVYDHSNTNKKTTNQQKDFIHSLKENLTTYDSQLFSEWVSKVYDSCHGHCIREDLLDKSELRPIEKECARICMKKIYNSYQLLGVLQNANVISIGDERK